MLYSAGMGAGILLRAVQEPVFMQQHPPLATQSTAETIALEFTFYQWGFTAWAFYAVFALAIGYAIFKRNLPVATSSTFARLLPTKISSEKSPILCQFIDILTILTTVFGLVAAVGLGASQIKGGLNHLFEIDLGYTTIIALVVLIGFLSLLSALSGVDKGIKRLSTWNIYLTVALLLFVFVQCDIPAVSKQFLVSLYRYIIDFIPMSLAIGRYDPGQAFLTDWTYYYWAFWLAWAPFTGFEMINSWGSYSGEFDNVFTSIFVFLEHYPAQGFINMVVIILLVSFLVTSVDSAIYVLSMFTDKGNPDPSKKQRLVWSIILTVFCVGIVLLGHAKADSDVLTAMQKLLIITSLPLSLLMVLMIILWVIDISQKRKESIS